MFERSPSAIRFASALQKRKRARQEAGTPPADPAGTAPRFMDRALEELPAAAADGPPTAADAAQDAAATEAPGVESTLLGASSLTLLRTVTADYARLLMGSAAKALEIDAEETAALCGRFDPRQVLPPDVDETSRDATLSQLAASCTVEAAGTTTTWVLKAPKRAAALTRLLDEGRLAQRLDRPLPPTDAFGEMLRQLLRRGADLDFSKLSRENVLALSAAMEATAHVPIPRPDPAKVHALIAQTRFLAPYDVLLERGFVGRDRELKMLEEAVQQARPGPPLWTGLVLTGLGGAGKSTLLAHFARRVMQAESATVIVLDYDRPGIDPRDTYWLEMEITRQVAYQYPATDAPLRTLRYAMRQQQAERDHITQTSAAAGVDVARGLRTGTIDGIRDALATAGALQRPFLIVLDTFEEVAQRDLTARTIEWLNEIGERLSGTPVSIIFSGRLFDESRAELAGRGVTRAIELDELDADCAADLLRYLGVADSVATRLAESDVLPRRPLEVKMLARLFTTGVASHVDELEEDVRRGGPVARELFAGIVYRRVLQRLTDTAATTALASPEIVKALASPGLVLRFVTVEVIQQVLGPALDLPAMTDDEAGKALQALASYEWLATRASDGAVWHRRDLRRSMLKAMIAEEPELARKIHAGAAEYFGQASTDRERAEAVYHRLMAMESWTDGDTLELAELKKANEHIVADIADLPPVASALMRFALGVTLSINEVVLLPRSYIERAYHEAGTICVNSRQFGTGLQLFAMVRSEWGTGNRPRPSHTRWEIQPGPYESWEIETLFATASWDLLDGPLAAPDVSFRPKAPPTLLFPAAIVSPDRLNDADVAYALSARWTNVALERPDAQVHFGRQVICLVLLNDRRPLSTDERAVIDLLLIRLRPFARNVSASLARRMLLLELLGGNPQPRTLLLSPLTALLHPAWLDLVSAQLKKRPVGVSRRPIQALLKQVRTILAVGTRGRHTIRGTLGAINALASGPGADRILQLRLGRIDDVDYWRLLRGQDPEFRDPCRFALMDAFPGDDGLRRLGELLASTIPLTLDDLEPAAFVEAVSDNVEHGLESYVELADRAGVLGDLLRRAHEARPDAHKLARVWHAHDTWIRAERDLFGIEDQEPHAA